MRWSSDKTGYTDVPNVVFDVIMKRVSNSAFSVYLRIYRQTVGWKVEFDEITLADFRKMTGIKQNKTVLRALTELKKLNLIVVKEEHYNLRSYGINIDTLNRYDLERADKEECV